MVRPTLQEQFVFQTKTKIKNIFTKVLKGHIAVATTNISKDDVGKKIDKRARKFLNQSNLDYAWYWTWCWFFS